MDTIPNAGTNSIPLEEREGVVKDLGLNELFDKRGIISDEAILMANEYIKRLEQRYKDFEALLSSGYF